MDYTKHLTTARYSEDLKKIVNAYGVAGYGFYWMAIEMMLFSQEPILMINLQKNGYKRLSRTEAERIILDSELFNVDELNRVTLNKNKKDIDFGIDNKSLETYFSKLAFCSGEVSRAVAGAVAGAVTGAVAGAVTCAVTVEDYLTVNSYSRPGISTHKLTGIVIHYTAEPGVTAKERRDYYEGLAESHAARASVNYIVGLEGEVIVCVPPGEVAYASNDRNLDTISVEYCHADESGAVSEATYRSMVELIRQLCEKHSIAPENVIRHYDVTGKLCPKYYVEDQAAWEKLLSDIKG